MSSRSTLSRDLLANETVADWLDALGIDPTTYQPLDADLTALAALDATAGMLARTGAGAFAVRTLAVSGTGLSIANPTGAAGAPAITIDPAAVVGAVGTIPAAAVQAGQETGTSTTTYVAPGTQQFHPSAAKCWAQVTVATGTPTLGVNYNITSITDTGTGRLTITIATDFSSANWCSLSSTQFDYSTNQAASAVQTGSMAAGSVEIDAGFTGGGRVDPVVWYFAGFGDQ